MNARGWSRQSALRSRTAGQAAIYSAASALASASSGIARGVLAAVLSISSFGAYSVAQTLLSYLSMFTEFGLFLPAARASALSDEEDQREILGAVLLLYIPVGVVFVLAVFALSFVVGPWFHVPLASPFRFIAVISVAWPFAWIGLQLSQGVGRLHVAALTTLAGNASFLIALVAMRIWLHHVSLTLALVTQSLTILGSAVLFVVWVRPRIAAPRDWIARFVRDARSYGFQVYVGRVLSTGTYNLDVLMLAALTSSRVVASYALAGAVAMAVGLPVTGLASALFRNLARSDRLPQQWLTASYALGAASVPASWLVLRITVGTIFSRHYEPAIVLAIPLAMAQGLRGITAMYNSFLSAQGRGRELRNAAVALTASNVVLNFTLIPLFGAEGAAWASVAALVVNWLAHIVGYRRIIASPSDHTTVDAPTSIPIVPRP